MKKLKDFIKITIQPIMFTLGLIISFVLPLLLITTVGYYSIWYLEFLFNEEMPVYITVFFILGSLYMYGTVLYVYIHKE